MAKNIEDIFDEMDDTLDEAKAFPLTGGKCLVDIEPLRNSIEDARLCLPIEIKQARAIVSDRAEIIAAAKKEAEELISKAENKAKQMVSENEITRRAQENANQIISDAQTKARETTRAAADFIENIINKTEECLNQNISDVKSLKLAFKNRNKQ